MRLARYARIFRVVRLVRVTRLFRVCMTDGVHHIEEERARPSNVGRLLAQKATQRIVALIIAMILVLPYLEVAPASGEVSMHTNLESISHITPIGSRAFNISVNKLVSTMEDIGQPFIYLSIAGRVVVTTLQAELAPLRFTDTRSSCVPICKDGVSQLSDYATAAQNDVSRGNSVQAQHSMALCLFVVFAFVGASTAVSHDARKIVIRPIERMTKIVKKLASTVRILTEKRDPYHQQRLSDVTGGAGSGSLGMLGGGGGGGSGASGANTSCSSPSFPLSPNVRDGQHRERTQPESLGDVLTDAAFEHGNEAELLEKVMEQMTKVLDHHQSRTSGGGSRRSSRFGLFHPNSHKIRGSFQGMRQSAGLMWKSRFSGEGSRRESNIAAAAAAAATTTTAQSVNVSENSRLSYMGVPRGMRSYRELHSIKSILQSRKASYYLRQFMAQSLTLENFMFYQEVESLRSMQIVQRQRVYDRFIDSQASNSINIDSQTRNRVQRLIEETGRELPTIFDDAQNLIVHLMELNTFQSFLKSGACEKFVREKEQTRHAVHVSGA